MNNLFPSRNRVMWQIAIAIIQAPSRRRLFFRIDSMFLAGLVVASLTFKVADYALISKEQSRPELVSASDAPASPVFASVSELVSEPPVIRIETAEEKRDSAYIQRFQGLAIAEMERSGVPASIKMAQGILETKSGTSILARKGNNHFGIKCHSKRCAKGHCMNVSDDSHKDFFRRYESAWASWRAHSEFLQGDRYAHLQDHGKDYKAWAHGLKKAGYATDKRYAEKLIGIIEKYQLDRLDAGLILFIE